MIPENLRQARRLFWLGRTLLALSAILLPVVAYGLALLLVDGHAQKEYFEAVSQILPVLLLALAIEQRYFTRRQSMPEFPPELEWSVGTTPLGLSDHSRYQPSRKRWTARRRSDSGTS